MARQPQGARAPDSDVIEGEVVEATERALVAMSVNGSATLDSSMAAILTRVEIDQMVVTARANPRSAQRAMDATKEIACLTVKGAGDCGYALPRGRDDTTGKQNVITGPSVRLAEIVACQWGNCHAASRVTEVNRTEGWVEAEGVFIDYQTNYRVTSRVRRSIRGKPYQGKPGKVFGDDMINVTSNAAAAIAFRNAVFKGVPKPVWDWAYEETQKIVRGDEKSLGARRVDLLTAYRDVLKIPPDKVYVILGVKGEQDIGLDELVVAAGFFSALKNGEVTLEDLIRHVTPATGAKGLGDAYTAGPAQQQQTPAHDPETGEVQDGAGTQPSTAAQSAGELPSSTGPDAGQAGSTVASDPATEEAGGSDVIQPGYAAAGVAYHLASNLDVDKDERRQTYKDGKPMSRAKPSSGYPIFRDHPPLHVLDKQAADQEAAAGAGDAGESKSPPTSDALPAADGGDRPAAAEADLDDLPSGEGEAADDEADAGDAGVDVADEDEVTMPEVFTDYFESIGTKDSYLTVKSALSTLRKSEGYQAADGALQGQARRAAFDATEALRDAGRDPVTPANDPAYYALWVEFADPRDIDATWQRLFRSDAFKKCTDAQKDTLRDATAKAKAAAGVE